jgi:redox-sensitive bicupin YhaK (pirin superfamily)
MSPFLLLDYGAPHAFPPTEEKFGVGEHPHRGFETVTFVYQGQVEHRDSTGGGGVIGPGEVQWMTAGSGIVHEEFHGRDFAKAGGTFQMIQLWVNLPKKCKMIPPAYQGITQGQIPEAALPNDSGKIRVIAGQWNQLKGPAQTQSPMNIWSVEAKEGTTLELNLPEGWTTGVFLLSGQLELGGGQNVNEAELAVMERAGTLLKLKALRASNLLLLSGEPLDEPIIGSGPFVMNTEAEIRQAYQDYRAGKMGRLSG